MPDARAARPASPLPCLHDTAGGRSLGEQTTTVQEFIENLECDFLEDSQSGWEDSKGSHGDGGGLVVDLAKRETILPGLRQIHWDLVIADDSHRMLCSPPAREAARYSLGELLKGLTDRFLMLAVTSHKGDRENFSLFLRPMLFTDRKKGKLQAFSC